MLCCCAEFSACIDVVFLCLVLIDRFSWCLENEKQKILAFLELWLSLYYADFTPQMLQFVRDTFEEHSAHGAMAGTVLKLIKVRQDRPLSGGATTLGAMNAITSGAGEPKEKHAVVGDKEPSRAVKNLMRMLSSRTFRFSLTRSSLAQGAIAIAVCHNHSI